MTVVTGQQILNTPVGKVAGLTARTIGRVLAELAATKAGVDHVHSGYAEVGLVSLNSSAYAGAVSIAGKNQVEVLLDANLANFDVSGFQVGIPKEVLCIFRQNGTGGWSLDFSNTWTWFSAGSGIAAVEPPISDDPNAVLVAVVSSSDGGTTKAAYFLGIARSLHFGSWPTTSDLATTTAGAASVVKLRRDTLLLGCDAICTTAPVGASVLPDLLYSTDQGTTWTTVWTNQAHRPDVATTTKTATKVTTFDVPFLQKGTWLTFVIDQVGVATKGKGLNLDLEVLEL